MKNLSKIPGVAQRYSDVEAAEFKRRPSLIIDEYLTKQGAVETIIAALDDLIAPTTSTTTDDPGLDVDAADVRE